MSPSMTGTPKVLSTRYVHANKWMRIREDSIIRPSGAHGTYTVVEKPNFAVIAAIEAGAIHIVEQHRYPVGGRFWELPQGSCDADPAETAARELREETGLIAGVLREVGFVHTAYGYSNQGCHVYLASQLRFAGQRLEPEEEGLVTCAVPIDRFRAMMRDGTIRDATTIAAFGLLVLHQLI